MPDDHHDPRTSDRIEAFLHGPAKPPRKRARPVGKRVHQPIRLDTRTDWNAALQREDARTTRYGRPVTVVVVDFIGPAEPTEVDRIAAPVGDAIRNEARETDRCARVGPSRFHLLLPETPQAEAAHFADRLQAACVERLVDQATDVTVRITAVSPVLGQSLADALVLAETRLAD
jgi:GGDEF domain-containing protein